MNRGFCPGDLMIGCEFPLMGRRTARRGRAWDVYRQTNGRKSWMSLSQVAQAVNAGLTKLYWEIGKHIHQEILNGDRADYGKQILATLSQELSQSFGSGFAIPH